MAKMTGMFDTITPGNYKAYLRELDIMKEHSGDGFKEYAMNQYVIRLHKLYKDQSLMDMSDNVSALLSFIKHELLTLFKSGDDSAKIVHKGFYPTYILNPENDVVPDTNITEFQFLRIPASVDFIKFIFSALDFSIIESLMFIASVLQYKKIISKTAATNKPTGRKGAKRMASPLDPTDKELGLIAEKLFVPHLSIVAKESLLLLNLKESPYLNTFFMLIKEFVHSYPDLSIILSKLKKSPVISTISLPPSTKVNSSEHTHANKSPDTPISGINDTISNDAHIAALLNEAQIPGLKEFKYLFSEISLDYSICGLILMEMLKHCDVDPISLEKMPDYNDHLNNISLVVIKNEPSIDTSSHNIYSVITVESLCHEGSQIGNFIRAINLVYQNYDWNQVLLELNVSDFNIAAPKFHLLRSLFNIHRYATQSNSTIFPLHLFFNQPWHNASTQFKMIKELIELPVSFLNISQYSNIFTFGSPYIQNVIDIKKLEATSVGNIDKEQEREAKILLFTCMEFLHVLLYFSNNDLFKEELRKVLLTIPCLEFPTIFVLALSHFMFAYNPDSVKTESNLLKIYNQDEGRHAFSILIFNIICDLLSEFPTSTTEISYVWQQDVKLVLISMSIWINEGNNQAGRIPIAILIGRKFNAIPQILSTFAPKISVDMAMTVQKLSFQDMQTWFFHSTNTNMEFITAESINNYIQQILSFINHSVGLLNDPSSKSSDSTSAHAVLQSYLQFYVFFFKILTIDACMPPFVSAFNSSLKGEIANTLNALSIASPIFKQAFTTHVNAELNSMINAAAPLSSINSATSCISEKEPIARSSMVSSEMHTVVASTPVSEHTDTQQLETLASRIFANFYKGKLSLETFLNNLKLLKTSPVDSDKLLFSTIIHIVFDEYKCFTQYPERELLLTGMFFGNLLLNQLLDGELLYIGFSIIIDALKQPEDDKLFKFGQLALEKLEPRLTEYPDMCHHLLQIENMNHKLPAFYAKLTLIFDQNGKDYISSSSSISMRLPGDDISIVSDSNTTVSISSNFATTTNADELMNANSTNTLNIPLQTRKKSKDLSTNPNVESGQSVNLGDANLKLANITDVQKMLAYKTIETSKIIIPEDNIINLVHFIFNNLTQDNMKSKVNELKSVFYKPRRQPNDSDKGIICGIKTETSEQGELKYLSWLAHYLVVKRVICELNFHPLYIEFAKAINNEEFDDNVLDQTYINIHWLLEIANRNAVMGNSNERSALKCLGSWLGLITIGKDKPILWKNLKVKETIINGHKNDKLISIIPFVCKILVSCSNSRVFRPPNPWTMSILRLLKEIWQSSETKNNLKFEIQLLFNNIGVNIEKLVPSSHLNIVNNETQLDKLDDPLLFASASALNGQVAKTDNETKNILGSPKNAKYPILSGPLKNNVPKLVKDTGNKPSQSINTTSNNNSSAMSYSHVLTRSTANQPPSVPSSTSANIRYSKEIAQSTTNTKFTPMSNFELSEATIMENLKLSNLSNPSEFPEPLFKHYIYKAIEKAIYDVSFKTDQRVEFYCLRLHDAIMGDNNRMDDNGNKLPKQTIINQAKHTITKHLTPFLHTNFTDHFRKTFFEAVNTLYIELYATFKLYTMQYTETYKQSVNAIVSDNVELAFMHFEKHILFKSACRIEEMLLISLPEDTEEDNREHAENIRVDASLNASQSIHQQQQLPVSEAEFEEFNAFASSKNSSPQNIITLLQSNQIQLSWLPENIQIIITKLFESHLAASASPTSTSLNSNSLSDNGDASESLPNQTSGPIPDASEVSANNYTHQVLEKVFAIIQELLYATSNGNLVEPLCIPSNNNSIHAFLRIIDRFVFQPPNRVEICLATVQRILTDLFSGAEKNSSQRDILIYILQNLNDIFPQVRTEINQFYQHGLKDEQKFNPLNIYVVLTLLRANLLDVKEVDTILTVLLKQKFVPASLAYTLQMLLLANENAIMIGSGLLAPRLPLDQLIATLQNFIATASRKNMDYPKEADHVLEKEGNYKQYHNSLYSNTSPESESAVLLFDECIRISNVQHLPYNDKQLKNFIAKLQHHQLASIENTIEFFQRCFESMVFYNMSLIKEFVHKKLTAITTPTLNASSGMPNEINNENTRKIQELLANGTITLTQLAENINVSSVPINTQPMDALSKLIVLLTKVSLASDTDKEVEDKTNESINTHLSLLSHILMTLVSTIKRDLSLATPTISSPVSNGINYNQRSYFRLLLNLICELTDPSDQLLMQASFPILKILTHTLHLLRPSEIPSFAFCWLELISHSSLLPKFLNAKINLSEHDLHEAIKSTNNMHNLDHKAQPLVNAIDGTSSVPSIIAQKAGWYFMHLLICDLFHFLAPFLSISSPDDSINTLITGTLRVLLVLLHDFPEFLSEFYASLCDIIPVNCIQLKNIILSAFPRTMRLPDPFTSTLKIDMLSEIKLHPKLLSDYTAPLHSNNFKATLDSYLQHRDVRTLLTIHNYLFTDYLVLPPNSVTSKQPTLSLLAPLVFDTKDKKYSHSVINALVLYVGVEAISQLQRDATTTITHSTAMDIFQQLAMEMNDEGRVLLYMFTEASQEITKEQITRVLVERLIVNRPHPWGLLITFIELIKNPRFNFWASPFVNQSREINNLLINVASQITNTSPDQLQEQTKSNMHSNISESIHTSS